MGLNRGVLGLQAPYVGLIELVQIQLCCRHVSFSLVQLNVRLIRAYKSPWHISSGLHKICLFLLFLRTYRPLISLLGFAAISYFFDWEEGQNSGRKWSEGDGRGLLGTADRYRAFGAGP